MLSIGPIKVRWYWVILISIWVEIVLYIRRRQTYYVIPQDAKYAIERAKTDSCKKELQEFALKSVKDGDSYLYLTRSCKNDSSKERNQRLGCLSNSTSGLVKLEDIFTNTTVCLDLCFSYGHSHGGFQSSVKKCYCGAATTTGYSNHTDYCSPTELDWFSVNNGIYYPTTSNLHRLPSHRKIKIAFLISVNGRSGIQVRRILRNIYSTNHIYHIHVDNRDQYLFKELARLEAKYDNIFLARSRFNTVWGGPSLLRMMIDAMGHLYQHDWDYLINLSESDFPLKGLFQLEEYLTSNAGLIYLKSHNINGYDFIKKQGLDWNFYQCENRVWRIGKRRLPAGIIYSGGSDWFALPREFCVYIREQMSNQSSMVNSLLHFYNHTLLPAESFFHTLALNSEFCNRFVDNNLRMTNWQRKQGCKCQHKDVVDWCGCSPLIYRWSDWGRLKQTNSSESLFFSRKFDPTVSSSIISAVEQHLVRGNQLASDYDTRYWLSVHEFDESKYAYLNKYVYFALDQIGKIGLISNELQLHGSVYCYFNQDRLVGHIFKYCAKNQCLQALIEKNTKAHLSVYNQECFGDSRQLQVIEVNHGFDTGERMFRNYSPLNQHSDIVVYHEWLIKKPDRLPKNESKKLQFVWVDPHGTEELIQNIKLRATPKLTRLSLAHRMSINRPFAPGLWALIITNGGKICLKYEFLVFDDGPLSQSTITRKQFNRFYTVSRYCLDGKFDGNSSQKFDNCDELDWTLSAKESFVRSHGLV